MQSNPNIHEMAILLAINAHNKANGDWPIMAEVISDCAEHERAFDGSTQGVVRSLIEQDYVREFIRGDKLGVYELSASGMDALDKARVILTGGKRYDGK